MKLIIGGSTGFVASELLSQALKNPEITSIIALGRREATLQADTSSAAATTKLKSIICDNFEEYPDSVKSELENADACIWTIAVTPMKLSTVPWDETCKISRDYATTAIKTLRTLRQNQEKPLRFIYMSGHFAPRSRAEIPAALKNHGMIDYGLLRGETETLILDIAEKSQGTVQSCIVKPGLIDAPGAEKREIPGLPHIDLPDIAAALLDQVIHGFEKDTLSNDDLVRIGQRALAE